MINPKMFPDFGYEGCTHTIGVFKSGNCMVCGYKLLESLDKRAEKLGFSVKNFPFKPTPRHIK